MRTLPDGTQLHFDTQGAMTARIDRNGNTTSFGYDAAGRLASVTDPVGRETTLAHAGGRLSRVTDPAGRDTFFQHDGAGNLTRAELPDGGEREFGYDARHLMTEETSARGFTTGRVFDFAGRLVSVALPDAAGTVRMTANGQGAGLVNLASGVGTASNPAPVVRPRRRRVSSSTGRVVRSPSRPGRSGRAARSSTPQVWSPRSTATRTRTPPRPGSRAGTW